MISRHLRSRSLWSRWDTAITTSIFTWSKYPQEAKLFVAENRQYLQGSWNEYGRIPIEIMSDGSVRHSHPERINVTEDEVVITMKIMSTTAQEANYSLAFYAVHQTTIAPQDTDVSVSLIPMQPSRERKSSVKVRSFPFAGYPSKPLDFRCTEIDMSAVNGWVSFSILFIGF